MAPAGIVRGQLTSMRAGVVRLLSAPVCVAKLNGLASEADLRHVTASIG
jgi:hypothetical protein